MLVSGFGRIGPVAGFRSVPDAVSARRRGDLRHHPGGLQEAVAFPLGFYRDFILEHRYELSTAPVSTWLRDHAKAFALSTLFLLLAAEMAYALIGWNARWWWLPAGLLAAGAAALLAQLAPVLLLPVFYKFTPLDRATLADRLLCPVAQRRCSGAWCL